MLNHKFVLITENTSELFYPAFLQHLRSLTEQTQSKICLTDPGMTHTLL